METSDALDLEPGVFKREPHEVAESLKRSAERRTPQRSRARTDFQAAMSMLNFYINRAGRGLPEPRRRTLERAKTELRRAFARA